MAGRPDPDPDRDRELLGRAAVDRLARQTASLVALAFAALLLVVAALMILATAAVAPDAVTLLLAAAWVVAGWLAWRWRRRPLAVLAVPVALAMAVWALTALGTGQLGWSG